MKDPLLKHVSVPSFQVKQEAITHAGPGVLALEIKDNAESFLREEQFLWMDTGLECDTTLER
jgi:hypothetical protein